MGHTAHDVSTLAARQGADVMLTSMQPIEEMNAAKHEIEDAQREGVKIRGNLLPKKVIVDEKTRARQGAAPGRGRVGQGQVRRRSRAPRWTSRPT